MTKNSRQIDRLCTRPPPTSFRWAELKALLEQLGFRMLAGQGSRRKFYHPEKRHLIICHQPHPSPDVDKGCIKDIADKLREWGMTSP